VGGGGGMETGGTGDFRQKGLPKRRVTTENNDVIVQVNSRQAVGKKLEGRRVVNCKEHRN